MNISEFKKGDKIVRVSPVKERVSSMGFGLIGSHETTEDWCLVGQDIEFVGIANGCIYYKKEYKLSGMESSGNELKSILHEKYAEGWEKYIDPATL